ncbi:MAG: hypothetical protein QOH96_3015 [Blastocatellia bacterium]|nr:hypothetical protein [Blastocatellia bacterium]
MLSNADAKFHVYWWREVGVFRFSQWRRKFMGKMTMPRFWCLFVDFSGLVRVRNETPAAAGLVHASGADGNSLL